MCLSWSGCLLPYPYSVCGRLYAQPLDDCAGGYAVLAHRTIGDSADAVAVQDKCTGVSLGAYDFKGRSEDRMTVHWSRWAEGVSLVVVGVSLGVSLFVMWQALYPTARCDVVKPIIQGQVNINRLPRPLPAISL